MKFEPHPYQNLAIEFLIQRTIVDQELGAMLFLDPGLGKTSCTLAWINIILKLGIAKKVLIVAPLKVCYSVWPSEIAKWDQFRHLTYSIVHGTPEQRMAGMSRKADIYITNVDGIKWLRSMSKFKKLPFDVIVLDESSKYKTWGSDRTKALREIIPQFKHRICLTGTPCPNGLIQLFPQVFMADNGKALGKTITSFREKYFYRVGQFYNYKPHANTQAYVENAIKDVALTLLAKDHLDMPELVNNDIWVTLPKKRMAEYKRLEALMFIELAESEGKSITPKNAGAKYNLCKQYCNGGVYLNLESGGREIHHLHDLKTDALEDLVDELQGKPVLVGYQYEHDLIRLQRRFKNLEYINGSVSPKKTNILVDRWNNDDIQILAVQPKSLSHGVNMQSGSGRDVVWYGLTDDLEDYSQFIRRVYRQGVGSQVRNHRILCANTVDVAIRERVDSKEATQLSLLQALSNYRSNMQ